MGECSKLVSACVWDATSKSNVLPFQDSCFDDKAFSMQSLDLTKCPEHQLGDIHLGQFHHLDTIRLGALGIAHFHARSCAG